jgi:hypothetical protein
MEEQPDPGRIRGKLLEILAEQPRLGWLPYVQPEFSTDRERGPDPRYEAPNRLVAEPEEMEEFRPGGGTSDRTREGGKRLADRRASARRFAKDGVSPCKQEGVDRLQIESF